MDAARHLESLAADVRDRETAQWRERLAAEAAGVEERSRRAEAAADGFMRGWLCDMGARYGDDVLAALRPRVAEARAVGEAAAVAAAEVRVMEEVAAARRGASAVLPGLQALRDARTAGAARRARLARLCAALEASWDTLHVPTTERTRVWWAIEAAVPATWSGSMRWQATARAVALIDRLQDVAIRTFGPDSVNV